jgi:NTE family protein
MEGFQYGQPFFFKPRHPHPTLQPRGSIEATSYYDTTPLIETLEEFIDFEYLNAMHTQLLLGAVKVRTGELVFFNNRKEIMRAQHIMASGAMPPGFPGVRIHNELYWDGGIVSNTPLQGIYEARHPKDHVLTFMIDLFSATGDEPRDMDEVQMRMKDISYASRTAHHIKHLSRHHSLGHAFKNAIDDLPEEIKKNPIIREARKIENEAKFDIVHLVYSKPPHEISSSDCEFSKSSIAARRKQGYEDMKNILIKSPWLEVSHHGSRGFHFHKGDHRAI